MEITANCTTRRLASAVIQSYNCDTRLMLIESQPFTTEYQFLMKQKSGATPDIESVVVMPLES